MNDLTSVVYTTHQNTTGSDWSSIVSLCCRVTSNGLDPHVEKQTLVANRARSSRRCITDQFRLSERLSCCRNSWLSLVRLDVVNWVDSDSNIIFDSDTWVLMTRGSVTNTKTCHFFYVNLDELRFLVFFQLSGERLLSWSFMTQSCEKWKSVPFREECNWSKGHVDPDEIWSDELFSRNKDVEYSLRGGGGGNDWRC